MLPTSQSSFNPPTSFPGKGAISTSVVDGFDRRRNAKSNELSALQKNADAMKVLKILLTHCSPAVFAKILQYNEFGGSMHGISLNKGLSDEVVRTLREIPGNFFQQGTFNSNWFFECKEARLILFICGFEVREEEDKTNQTVQKLKNLLFPGIEFNMPQVEEQLDQAAALLETQNDNDKKKAFNIYYGLAKSRNAFAMWKIAEMYLAGVGTDKNKIEGNRWVARAAFNGNPEALHYVATVDELSTSLVVNQPKAPLADVIKHFVREGSYTRVEKEHFLGLRQVWRIVAKEVKDMTGYAFEERLTFFKDGLASGELTKIFFWLPKRVESLENVTPEMKAIDKNRSLSLQAIINHHFGPVVLRTESRQNRSCLVLDPEQLKNITNIKNDKNIFLDYSCSEFEALSRPGQKDPVNFPYAKYENKLDINEINLVEFLCVIHDLTINTPYHFRTNGFGIHRPNHNGTHSVRQAEMVNYAIDKIEQFGNDNAKRLLKELSPEQILAVKLAVFMCRAGRVDESSERTKKEQPDFILKRSAQLFGLYAQQTNLPVDVINDTMSMMEKIYDDDHQSVFTEGQIMLMNLMKAAHNLDLYRCFSPERMVGEENWARLSITPYFDNVEFVLQGMIVYSKNMLTATGVNLNQLHGYGNDIYKACSNNIELCMSNVKRVSTDMQSALLPWNLPMNPPRK